MASRNSWLSSVGDYGTLVRNLAVSDPRLRQRDPKLVRQGTPWENATSKAVIFQKLDGVGQFSTSLPFCDGPSLSKFLDDPSSQGQDDQQLVVVQGLNPEIIGAIGCHFRMHPSFFVEHEKAVVIAPRDGGEGDGPVLPSMAMTREHMTFKYYESFTLPENLQGNFTLCCADSGRHIGVTRLRGQFSRVGMLRRKCSLWRRQRHGGKGWDSQ